MLEIDLTPHAIERGVETLGVEGLEQIIKRANLERPNGILVVGRDKNDLGRRRTSCVENLGGPQAVHGGHPDVEQHEVGPQRANAFNRLESVRRFTNENRVEVAGEQPSELVARVGFVVGDENAKSVGHVATSSGSTVGSSSSNIVARSSGKRKRIATETPLASSDSNDALP